MWYAIWVEVRRYRDRDDIRIFWPGCRWGRTWMEMKRTSMGLRRDLGVAELHFQDMDGGETSPGWKWDANIRTSIEVRRNLDCGELWISGPGWTWQGWRWDANNCNLYGAWMEVTQESWDLNAGDGGSGWRWETNLGTWIALRSDLEGAAIQSTRPGWGWDGTWIELRCTSWDVDRVIWD